MKFAEFELRPELNEAIQEIGYLEATPIQELVIPQILKGKDVSGLAQTGTGKTAAFVVPLIERILRFRSGETGERVPPHWKKNSYVLVLVPTRELAVQVEATIGLFGKKADMKSVVVVGGSGYDEQRGKLRKGVEFVVGTPGRLLDLYKTHDLDLNGVGAIVFDEADRMFDMGFKDDMKYILKRVPRQRQFLLFSATLNFEVLNTAYMFGAEPVEFNVSRDQATAEGIDHEILHVGQFEKPMYLLSVLKKYSPQQCIVFSNFKHMVSHLSRFLKSNGIDATEMSSLLSQQQRNKVLESFKSGQRAILVATDVAARGLDVKGIDLVINFDLPDDPEGYIHRIGRTGRAGGSGRAVGLVSDRDVEALARIENYLKEKLKVGWLEDTDLVKEFKAFNTDERPERTGNFQRPPSNSQQRRPPPRGGARSHAPRGPAPRGPAPAPRSPATNQPNQSQNRPQVQSRPGSPVSAPGSAPTRTTTQNRPATSGTQTPPATGHQHRDRKMGRHGGGIAGSTTGGERQNQMSGKPPRRNEQGPQKNFSPKRRPLHKPNTSKQGAGSEAGVGGKIKSFLSKLFK